MTISVRQQARDQVIAELNAAPPTGIPEATKRRFVPGQVVTSPRIAVFFAEEDASEGPVPLTKRDLVLAVQAIVAVEDPAQADDAVEPLLVHIVSVLGETNLGGLAHKVVEASTLWGSQQADLFYLVALTRWRVRFQTHRAKLDAKQ